MTERKKMDLRAQRERQANAVNSSKATKAAAGVAGAAGGAAAGAAIGILGGPVGAAAGAVAGGVLGSAAGGSSAEKAVKARPDKLKSEVSASDKPRGR